MSAEVESAEMILRLTMAGITEVVRFIPTGVVTVGQLVGRAVTYVNLKRNGSPIVNSPGGSSWMRIPD